MHFAQSAAIAALFAVSNASPVEVPRLGFQVSAPILASIPAEGASSFAALVAPFTKFKAPLTPQIAVAKAVQKTTKKTTASVSADPTAVDIDYLVPVKIQGKTFNLILDTGSSDLWVFSSAMPAANLTGRPYYTITGATSKLLQKGLTFGTAYGDGGSASGAVYADKVTIGAATATAQAVEAATSVSSGYISNRNIDGMLGLGMTDANTVRPTQQNTFFDSVRTSLAKPLFAVTFKHSVAGSFDLGFLNTSKYTGNLNYAPVTASSGYWEFPIRRYGINGTNYNYGENFAAIVDTGTTLMYLPQNIVTLYYSKIPGAKIDTSIGAWTFPCTSTLLPLGIFVNGTKYTVPAKYINWQSGLADNHCWGGLQSSANLPFAILGSVFLKSVYAVFDMSTGSARVGFGKQA